MEMDDLGRVYHYLLKYRAIESNPNQRRSRDGEKVVASILRLATFEQLNRLNEFLSPQGFVLVEFDDSTRGVTAGGKVWVMARLGEPAASSFVSSERVYYEMDIRGQDTRETSAIWFLHIWLIYLSLVYTRSSRGISEISSYIDATFSKEALQEAVEEHIAHIRKLGVCEGAQSKVVEILDAEKGKDVARRVNAFLKLMSTSGLVQELEKNEYQQSLLGAYEISRHYDNTLRVPVDNVLGNLVNIVAPNSENDDTDEAGEQTWG